eukprot:NODE_1296_length_1199_cov_50.957391_g1065_i0.p2 GENE.NODE_1296_length_1199_cov_50.957391_g1065_i0~~NODE_1296_length_1199_cov_50.957391_g1065_i0.p2  ORF type:complete len:181 (-),score=42.17 NODE_1296_length_1199_cov_50.957391_g1065_i0:111-653(-)
MLRSVLPSSGINAEYMGVSYAFALDGPLLGKTLRSIGLICGSIEAFFASQAPRGTDTTAVNAHPRHVCLHLGEIRMLAVECCQLGSRAPPSATSLRADDHDSDAHRGTRSFTVSWEHNIRQGTHVAYANVYVNAQFAGRAYADMFRVECVPSGEVSVSVQVVDSHGTKQRVMDLEEVCVV